MYRNTHDVKFDDDLWKADTKNARGKNVDSLADPDDGSAVASEKD